MIRYLNSRECPNCNSTVTIMLLRYGSKLGAINGVCGGCDYSIKWLIIQGNVSTATNLNLPNPISAPRALKNGQSTI